MDASCLRFCCSFFHLVAPYQTWQLLSSAGCPAHLRYLCSIPWAWVLFWCSSAMADSSNLHCKVYYWDVSQDVRARMATAKWLSTFWLKTTGLALFTTLSAVTMRKQHQAMFYVHQWTWGCCLMSPPFDTESCKEKNKTEQHLLACTSVVAQGTGINQVKWESWFIMFSSSKNSS